MQQRALPLGVEGVFDDFRNLLIEETDFDAKFTQVARTWSRDLSIRPAIPPHSDISRVRRLL